MSTSTSSTSSDSPISSQDELDRLRQLVLGPDYEQALRTMLSQSDTERIAATISEAIIQRNLSDKSVAQALAPIIDDAIDNAIKYRPQRITRVIYPIIGPSIRKSVARALADMVQNLNQILESSLSLRAWGWRYQAWRAGMKYGEYVLLKTLDFRVEQVLLIHRETGILLHAENAAGFQTEDPELVSSMLTAVSDFVTDSFSRHPDTSLDNIRVGDFILEIETGPSAILAAAIRGTPSEKVSQVLRHTLERLHLVFSREFDRFNGDRAIFDSASHLMRPCLLTQHKEDFYIGTPWLALTAIALLLAYGGWESYQKVQNEISYRHILEYIRTTPGYVIVDESKELPHLRLEILRPPSSPPPNQRLAGLKTAPWQVNIVDHVAPLNMREYLLPLIPEMFHLGQGVEIELNDQTLAIKGLIKESQYREIEHSPMLQSVYSSVDLSAAQSYPEQSPKEQQLSQWYRLKAKIENIRFQFQPNTTNLVAGEEQKIPELVADLNTALSLAEEIPVYHWQLYIVGYANSAGSDNANIKISEARAKLISELLQANHMDASLLLAWGAGNLPDSRLPEHQQRMVSLQLIHSPIILGTEYP
ncbi:hypothetical protein BTA51_12860 [Hahella sp. CCB-MM4]|uniref:OmpA family protein n=1 Tax=Hahella sp. (strain CCB-MM4) TaxID=1926491 RepID=UPI000B9C5FA1|nr:OmpA family protein [Hahella sp. CCB-MM4]OZG72859.1 hypothetical protein BTA51_12860 [Hahella sp. CCB-MM4]